MFCNPLVSPPEYGPPLPPSIIGEKQKKLILPLGGTQSRETKAPPHVTISPRCSVFSDAFRCVTLVVSFSCPKFSCDYGSTVPEPKRQLLLQATPVHRPLFYEGVYHGCCVNTSSIDHPRVDAGRVCSHRFFVLSSFLFSWNCVCLLAGLLSFPSGRFTPPGVF